MNAFKGIGCLVLFLPLAAVAQVDISAELITDRKVYAPGDSVVLILEISIPKQYHLYSNPLGMGIGKPLQIQAPKIDHISWISLLKEPPERFEPAVGDWVWAYKKKAYFFLIGRLSSQPPAQLKGTLDISGIICHTSCLPVQKNIRFSITTRLGSSGRSFDNAPFWRLRFNKTEPMSMASPKEAGKSPVASLSLDAIALGTAEQPGSESLSNDVTAPNWDYSPEEKKAELNFLLAIFLGFIAGLILNVMPCVLPVLGIKIMSFSRGKGGSRKEIVLKSLVFSAGMISIFLVLASLAAFANFSWGQQFQNTTMLIAIVCIIVVFAFGLFDLYTIIMPSGIGSASQNQNESLVGDFVRGMFTTIMATPCSGPFLGATLAWTLTQPPIVIYTVFTAVGIGMAFPYVLFSASKTLMNLIPKPGPWMDDFKHAMGFILLGFAVYLLIGLPADLIIATVGFSLVLIFAIGIYGRFAPFGSTLQRKLISAASVIAFAAIGFYANFSMLRNLISFEKAEIAENIGVEWQSFSPEVLSQAHAQGRHVIIDFTANWCMNCQFNKITVLHSKEVSSLLEQKNILPLKADLTASNPSAESLLHHLGSRSVPFLAIFPGDKPYKPAIMRDLLKKRKVVEILEGLAEQ